MKIGITGGIGSGKSVVCKVFQAYGISIYDADTRAKYLMANHQELIQEIKKEFGEKAYKNSQLDRVFIAKRVFNNPEKLKKLNGLVHPIVREDYQNWVEDHCDEPFTLKEAALLIETKSYQELDKLIVVSAPIQERIRRVKRRDPFRSEDQIKQIIDKQLPEGEKIKKADFLIKNDESASIVRQVESLYHSLLK